jgi:hypothetical protein
MFVLFFSRGDIAAADLSTEIAERLGGTNNNGCAPVVELVRQWPSKATAAATTTTVLLRLPTAEQAAALKRRLNGRLLSSAENVIFLPENLNGELPVIF